MKATILARAVTWSFYSLLILDRFSDSATRHSWVIRIGRTVPPIWRYHGLNVRTVADRSIL
jgi:hypothetical protein